MATIENVTSARLNVCTLKGEDIRRLTRTVVIRESICCPYLTGEILVIDNQNVIVAMKLEGGELLTIEFDAPGGNIPYAVDMYLLDITDPQSSPENMMLKIYTLSVVSSEYFTDRGTLTPGDTTTVGMNGVTLAQKIWGDAGFKTPLVPPVPDAPLQDGENGLTIAHQKPISAIGQIRDIQVYPTYPTGNVLLFRDRKVVNHVPLQHIYQTCTPTEHFVQKETWGIDYRHMFVNSEAIHAIIDAKAVSRTTMLDPDEFKPSDQPQRGFDLRSGKYDINTFIGAFKGSGPNIPLTDSQRIKPENAFPSIIEKARWYAHCLKSRPQYLVKVPMNTGINITVGQGCGLTFTPEHTRPNSSNPANGTYLITDLMHELHNDLRHVLGTTTIKALSALPADRGICTI